MEVVSVTQMNFEQKRIKTLYDIMSISTFRYKHMEILEGNMRISCGLLTMDMILGHPDSKVSIDS